MHMRIKNIIRKATVAALTAVMILAPIVNVKAASSDVIDTSKTGSLTIHKYDMTAAKQAGVNLDQFTSTRYHSLLMMKWLISSVLPGVAEVLRGCGAAK